MILLFSEILSFSSLSLILSLSRSSLSFSFSLSSCFSLSFCFSINFSSTSYLFIIEAKDFGLFCFGLFSVCSSSLILFLSSYRLLDILVRPDPENKKKCYSIVPPVKILFVCKFLFISTFLQH